MVDEFKLTMVHCMPEPDADLCVRMDLPLDKKCGKSGLGLWAAGPSQAVGRWAVGLLLAKPIVLALAGYEMSLANSYPMRAHGIIVN